MYLAFLPVSETGVLRITGIIFLEEVEVAKVPLDVLALILQSKNIGGTPFDMPGDTNPSAPSLPAPPRELPPPPSVTTRWVERFSGLHYRRGSSGFSDAASAGGMTPPVDLQPAVAYSFSKSGSGSNSPKVPAAATAAVGGGASNTVVINKSGGLSVPQITATLVASPSDSFLEALPSRQLAAGNSSSSSSADILAGGEVAAENTTTLKDFLSTMEYDDRDDCRRGSITADLHDFRFPAERRSSFGGGGAGGVANGEEDGGASGAGQKTIVSKAVRDIQIQASEIEHMAKGKEQQQQVTDEMFSLDLGTEQQQQQQQQQLEQEHRVAPRPAWQVGDGDGKSAARSKPLGKLASYLLSSGLAQNWFFKREGGAEGEEEEDAEEERIRGRRRRTAEVDPIADAESVELEREARIAERRRQQLRKKQSLREMNFWSPQAL